MDTDRRDFIAATGAVLVSAVPGVATAGAVLGARGRDERAITSPSTAPRAEDRVAILQLMENERLWRDNGEWIKQLNCFSDDATVTVGWFQGTAKDFVASSRKQTKNENMLIAFHKVMPSGVQVDKDRALANSMIDVMARFLVDGVELDIQSSARNSARFVRTPDGWKIAKMDVIYLKDSLTPALPWQTVPLRSGELDGLRPSYRINIWVMGKLGYPVSRDILGSDRPEEIAAHEAANKLWLMAGM